MKPPQSPSLPYSSLRSLSCSITSSARKFDVMLDSKLKPQTCFFHLCTISKIKCVLTGPDLEKIINAVIFSRLDLLLLTPLCA